MSQKCAASDQGQRSNFVKLLSWSRSTEHRRLDECTESLDPYSHIVMSRHAEAFTKLVATNFEMVFRAESRVYGCKIFFLPTPKKQPHKQPIFLFVYVERPHPKNPPRTTWVFFYNTTLSLVAPCFEWGGAANSKIAAGRLANGHREISSGNHSLNPILTSMRRSRISALLAISAHFRAELPEAPHDSTALS
jgi:hypothetical protein